MEPNATMLLVLILLIIVDLALIFTAVEDLHKQDYVRGGNKVVWLMIIIFVGIIGPVLYFAWGREPPSCGV